MQNLKKSSQAWLVILLVASVLALAACGGTPLPPLFFVGGSGITQPAAPVAPAATSAPAAVAVAAPPLAASEAITITAPVVVESAAITSSAPITSAVVITTAQAAEVAVVQATATPTRVAPTATRVAPTATRVAPTATRAAPVATRAPTRPSATPTPEWPKTLVITADDIEQGASSVPGLQISGLDVTFGNDTMTMSFDSLRYSFVSMRNVVIEGHFEVSNGDVDFVADSITPRNLATGAIPGFINQSLDQQLSAWYVEAVTVQPGQLVATVRPR